MNIREATIEDIENLVSLFETYRAFYHQKQDAEGAHKFLSDHINNKTSKIFIAIDESGKVAGFVQLYFLFSSTRMKKLLLLNDLFVDEKYRGQGVSKLLIDKAKEFAVDYGACGLQLETQKSNIIGNQLYPATGFELDTEHNYYFWTNPTK